MGEGHERGVDPGRVAAGAEYAPSVVWRLGEYVPWRFRAAQPSQAGSPRQMGAIGPKVMDRLFATITPPPVRLGPFA
jgi:hypothetical protein